ncbi:hypothetical protein MTR67_003245 [Solanum verrucosum]|uniref:Uncharacterized protein n=1 Tax=Solanum verrucosum TaxID=315347 RepID=A0AAF0PTY8_SOLVR|nr:hypothetical protein MTR67_003245 [Solanum verrucosum]
MDSDSWNRIFTSSSRRYQPRSVVEMKRWDKSLNCRLGDVYVFCGMGEVLEIRNLGEEYDSEEETMPEFLCPFCAEDFDIVGLCCHIDDEHAVEAKNGVHDLIQELVSFVFLSYYSSCEPSRRGGNYVDRRNEEAIAYSGEGGFIHFWEAVHTIRLLVEIKNKGKFERILCLDTPCLLLQSALSPFFFNKEENVMICPVCAKRVGMDLVGHITQQHGNILKVQRRRRFRRGGTSALSILRRELREGSLQSILGGSSRLVSSSTTDPDPLLSSFIHNTPLANEIPDAQPLSSIKQSSKKESTLENSSERNVQQSPLSDKDQEEKARKNEIALAWTPQAKDLFWETKLRKRLDILKLEGPILATTSNFLT